MHMGHYIVAVCQFQIQGTDTQVLKSLDDQESKFSSDGMWG